MFGEPVATTLVRFFVCVRGCGCGEHPAFPAPSIFRGTKAFARLGRTAPREGGRAFTSLREAKRRSNPFLLSAAPWIASRSLSSGAHSRDPLAPPHHEGPRTQRP